MKNRLISYITKHRFYKWLVSIFKQIKFKNYENASLYFVIKIFVEKITKDEILQRANGVAFNFTLAIFPAILFVFTLVPFIHGFIPSVDSTTILAFLAAIIPESMYIVIASTIEDIVGQERSGLLTFGAVFSLYLAANGVLSLMRAFNSCYKTVEKRGFFKMRFVAIALTIMLAFALILAIVLLIVGNIVIDKVSAIEWIDIENYTYYVIMTLRFIVMFIVFYIAISFIYYFGPAVHYNWRFFSIGSIISTFLCLFASYGFSYYITNFETYNKLYGSIGALIALMIWQFILTVILLVGYEINASLHHAHRIVGEDEVVLDLPAN